MQLYARAGVGVPYILEIGLGASLESTFDADLVLQTGLDTKLYTKLTLDLDLKPLTFKMGLYIRHFYFKLWCPFKRRSLGESDLPQRPKLNTYYRRMQLAF